VIFFCWLQLSIRWTLPRFRPDQLMNLGWKRLLPLALLNVMITALVMLYVGR
jgi:NADH-quinone oxidoreductase subunit H